MFFCTVYVGKENLILSVSVGEPLSESSDLYGLTCGKASSASGNAYDS